MRILFTVMLMIVNLSTPGFAQSDTAADREVLAIAALEGLMSTSSDRALPLLNKVLASNHTDRVKSRALFVLSQINLPEAQQTLLGFAKNSSTELKQEAIRMIGVGGNKSSLAELKNIYASGDEDVKEQVLQAYLIAGDAGSVYELADNATSDQEFDTAIRVLGAMGATEQLRRLSGRAGQSESLIQAYAVSGDLESLLELVRTQSSSTDPDVRQQAISHIGIIGGGRANQALMDIYRGAENDEIKASALQGLLISGHDEGVLELYRGADNIHDKSQLLRTLTIMDSDAALDAIDSALDGNQP